MMTGDLLEAGVALVVCWLVLAAALIAARPKGMPIDRLVSLVPHTARLLGSLVRDRDVRRPARAAAAVAFVYDLQPINLIPDFIPLIGLLDNVVVTLWALRAAVRGAGPETVARHWSGDTDELTALLAVARLGTSALAVSSPASATAPRQQPPKRRRRGVDVGQPRDDGEGPVC